MKKTILLGLDENGKQIQHNYRNKPIIPQEPKQETIEEVARKYANITHNRPIDEEERYYKDYQKYDGFIAGYNECLKHQSEKMYSEDEVIGFADWIDDLVVNNNNKYCSNTTKELLEIYKKEKGL